MVESLINCSLFSFRNGLNWVESISVDATLFSSDVSHSNRKETNPLLNLSGLDLQNSAIAWMLIFMFLEFVHFVMNKFRGCTQGGSCVIDVLMISS